MENLGIWVENFRPSKWEELILESHIKNSIQKYLDRKDIANFLFHGTQGVGKTSLARLIPQILGREFLFINASLDNNLDVLRNTVTQFAQAVSFEGGKKIIILDEIDSTNNPNFLPALRPLIEKLDKNVNFIATCNNINIIPSPIISRFQDFNFNILDKKGYAKNIFDRIIQILNTKNIKYNPKVIAQIISKYFPDIRKVLNFCQQYELELENENILYKITKGKVDELFKYLKEKKFSKVKELVLSEWSNIDTIYKELYDNIKDYVDPNNIPQIILIIADYGRWHSLVVDKEIHITAMLLELSREIKFK